MKARIAHFEYFEDPRKDYDHLTKMICFHRRYVLGDKHDLKESDFRNWEDVEEYIKKTYKPVVIRPLFLMDHSGQTLSMSPHLFRMCDSAGWDWGQVGFIFITREDAKREKLTKKKAEKLLEDEFEEYKAFIEGDVYVVNVIDDSGETVDSVISYGNVTKSVLSDIIARVIGNRKFHLKALNDDEYEILLEENNDKLLEEKSTQPAR
jgi:hypothetical protein